MELTSANKIRLLCLLITGPSLLSLNSYGQPGGTFRGYNVGGGLGVMQFNSSISSTVTQNGVIDGVSGSTYGMGVKGNVFVGYSKTLQSYPWLYLGTELGVNVVSRREVTLADTSQSSLTGGAYENYIDIQQGYLTETQLLNVSTTVSRSLFEPTLDFKAGLLLTPSSLTYARVGVTYDRMSITTTSNYKATASQYADFHFFSYNKASYEQINQRIKNRKTDNEFGLRLGAGLTNMFSEHFALSMDYIYTLYSIPGFSQNGSSNQLVCDIVEGCTKDNNGVYQAKAHANASNQEVLLQLVYYLS